MSKGWVIHRAEIKRLHFDERKPIEEVREIMKNNHDFHPTTRAYRMKIEEWTLRKYKIRRERCVQSDRTKNASRSPIPVTKNSSTEPPSSPESPNFQTLENIFSGAGILIPSRPMKASEVLLLLEDPSANLWAIEILLWKWEPGGEYLNALARLLQDSPSHCKNVMRRSEYGKPLLFQLASDLVCLEEQLSVGKLLLEADYSVCHSIDYHDVRWLRNWQAACGSNIWEDAKNFLSEADDIISGRAGGLFLNSGRVVTAERLLQRLVTRMRMFGTGAILPSANPNDPYGPDERELCRQNYLEILEEFRHQLNLRPYFYRKALEILRESNTLANARQNPVNLDLADDCRQKYTQLENLLESPAGDFNDSDANSSSDAKADFDECQSSTNFSITPESNSVSDSHVDTFAPLPTFHSHQNSCKQPAVPSETRLVVKTLLSKWRDLKGFKSYAHSLLIQDGAGISIFEPTAVSDNLFDIICSDVREIEHMSFIQTLLTAFATVNCGLPRILKWWISLYNSSSWQDFEHELDPKAVEMRLAKTMSPSAIKLVLDGTILLVGERFLINLNAEVVKHQRKSSTSDPTEYMENRRLSNQYMAILAKFQERKLEVDLIWSSLALNH